MISTQVHQVELSDARYAVSPHGAHVTSWWSAAYGDLLYLSSAARFAPGQAIRGGVPICFPWFANGPSGDLAPSHGYARLAAWREVAWEVDERRSVLRAGYLLGREGAAQVPGAVGAGTPFALRYDVELSPRSAGFRLAITNEGDEPAGCEAALHTYLRIGDVGEVVVDGLDGSPYVDKAAGGARRTQRGGIVLGAEVDRVYDSTAAVTVRDPALRRTLRVSKEGAPQTVVWNPGEGKAAALADVGDGEWRSFVCVEAAAVGDGAIRLAPGASYELRQEIVVDPA